MRVGLSDSVRRVCSGSAYALRLTGHQGPVARRAAGGRDDVAGAAYRQACSLQEAEDMGSRGAVARP